MYLQRPSRSVTCDFYLSGRAAQFCVLSIMHAFSGRAAQITFVLNHACAFSGRAAHVFSGRAAQLCVLSIMHVPAAAEPLKYLSSTGEQLNYARFQSRMCLSAAASRSITRAFNLGFERQSSCAHPPVNSNNAR